MEKKEMTCIACPLGCRLLAERDESGTVTVTGHTCKRGLTYGQQEFSNPQRMVTSSVWVDGGVDPMVSVRTKMPVPKAKIADVLNSLRGIRLTAPVRVGQVIAEDIAGTGVPLIATRNC